jgi:heme oxygenase
VRHSAVNPAQREKIFADITKSRKDVAKWKDMLKANKITAANQQQIVLEAKNATYNCQFQLKQLKEIKSMLNKPKK